MRRLIQGLWQTGSYPDSTCTTCYEFQFVLGQQRPHIFSFFSSTPHQIICYCGESSNTCHLCVSFLLITTRNFIWVSACQNYKGMVKRKLEEGGYVFLKTALGMTWPALFPVEKRGRGHLEKDHPSPTLTWSWELRWAPWCRTINAARTNSPDTTCPGSGMCVQSRNKNGLTWDFNTTSRSTASVMHIFLRPCKHPTRATVSDLYQTWNTLH